MTSPKETALVEKAAMLATPDEVVPTEDNEKCATISSQDIIDSSFHALSVLEVIKSTRRLNIHDEKDAVTSVNIDIPKCPHDDKALRSDSKPVGAQQSETASPLHIVSADETPSQTHPSTTLEVSTKSQTKIATESDTMALTNTEPVPTIYPPRRPNIFNKRAPQRNIRWRPELVYPQTDHATDDTENDGDGVTLGELQEFQSEIKEEMERKTARFMSMVRQYSWRPRAVEDLAEAFALED